MQTDDDHRIRRRKHKKRSFKKRARSRLGLRHITIKAVIIYICMAIILVFLVRPAIGYVTTFIAYFIKQQFLDNTMTKSLDALRDLKK